MKTLIAMILPPKRGTETPTLPSGSKQILIIGANGSGKTRFTTRLLSSVNPNETFALSPLRALFGAFRPDAETESVDAAYARILANSPLGRTANPPASEFERLMGLLLQEEMTNLLAYKMSGAKGPLPVTKLDKAITLWREIFPGNDILRSEGSLLFSSSVDGSSRSQTKLSAGEKVILYYFGAILFAPQKAIISIDSPEMFLHPATLRRVWDRVESLRPDCTFLYATHDLDFAATRSSATTIWVRDWHADTDTFDYDILPPDSELREEMYLSILGARRPVLFIEGDNTHSIDSKLYPLIFPDYTIKALGSCDRVIESTRVFNSLGTFHQLDSRGIVDRDRRTQQEIAYLRRKKIMVPEVAEIENLLMIEEVIKAVARANRRDENRAFEKTKSAIIGMFRAEMRQQALQHTRHQVKHIMEHRIDGRFSSITKLEEHISELIDEVKPRAIYEHLCREFSSYIKQEDYDSVLRVYNQKSMIGQSNVCALTGCGDKRNYITTVLNLLKTNTTEAKQIRNAIRSRIR